MKSKVFVTLGLTSLCAFAVPAAIADSYSSTTTTEQMPGYSTTSVDRAAPLTGIRTTTVQRDMPLSEVRTTTVESAPVTTIIREVPIYIAEPSRSTTEVVREKRRHFHLFSLPCLTTD